MGSLDFAVDVGARGDIVCRYEEKVSPASLGLQSQT